MLLPPVPCGMKPPECHQPCTREHDCNHPGMYSYLPSLSLTSLFLGPTVTILFIPMLVTLLFAGDLIPWVAKSLFLTKLLYFSVYLKKTKNNIMLNGYISMFSLSFLQRIIVLFAFPLVSKGKKPFQNSLSLRWKARLKMAELLPLKVNPFTF